MFAGSDQAVARNAACLWLSVCSLDLALVVRALAYPSSPLLPAMSLLSY